MKNKLMSLLLIPLLFSCGGKENSSLAHDEKNVDVIILCGQSNAEGFSSALELQNKVSENIYKTYCQGFSRTKIRYNCNNGTNKSRYFDDVCLGQGVTTQHFGPEMGMALAFDKAQLNRDVYIIKSTLGGTGIYIDSGEYSWASPSSGATGKLYTSLISWVKSSLKLIEDDNRVPHLRAICFMQGEHDACNATWAKAYEDNEYALFNDVFHEFEQYLDENYGTIDGLIQENTLWTYHNEINEAKINNTKRMKNAYVVDPNKAGLRTDTEPKDNPDIAHYDSLDMLELGKLFANCLIDNILK